MLVSVKASESSCLSFRVSRKHQARARPAQRPNNMFSSCCWTPQYICMLAAIASSSPVLLLNERIAPVCQLVQSLVLIAEGLWCNFTRTLFSTLA